MNRYREALEDARASVSLDPQFAKGYQRMVKCGTALADLTTAETAIKKLLELEPNNPSINNEKNNVDNLRRLEVEANKANEKKDFRKLLWILGKCLDIAPMCTRYKIEKAECLAFLGRYEESQEIANGVLHLDKGNADAIYVRGICLFYEDKVDQAFQHFQQVLRLAPDHKKAMDIYKRAKLLKKKKEEGNEAYKNNKFQDALNLYSEVI